MSKRKEYKFNGKIYTVARSRKGVHHCRDCAFAEELPHVCLAFLEKTGAPKCSFTDIAFKEKTAIKSATMRWPKQLKIIKETTWGANPSAESEEIKPCRVIPDKIAAENTWSFQLQMDNGYRPASISVIASKTAENCKFIAALLPDTERFIVCLIENGCLAPSASPKQHKSRENAEKEAERLCKLYHKEFAVLQVVSAIKPQEPKKEVFA